MTLRTIAAVQNAALSGPGAVVLADRGAGTNGTMEFYAGTPPTNIGDAPGQTLLATIDLQNPAFDEASGGAAALLGVPITTTGQGDDTVGWARILDTDGVALWDEDDVGTDAANAITVNTMTVSTGVNFTLNSYSFSAG